jgi:hypothetical protein
MVESMRERGSKVYIITWDMPPEDRAKRRMFYYYLKKIRVKAKVREQDLPTSVFETPDKKIARQVFELARRYGTRARVYVGRVLE